MSLARAIADLRQAADPHRAIHSVSYFKTGPGQYGEGDVFWGLKMGDQHRLARVHQALGAADLDRLLASAVHEQRMLGLLILRRQYAGGTREKQNAVYRFYVAHLDRVNNWDLVDCSASYIVGAHLANRSRAPVYRWVRSPNLWRRRVAMIATAWWIRDGDFADALKLAALLLNDGEDLMHKAVGWMLREIDKRDHSLAVRFLRDHCARLPRTTLRYAIERFPEAERRAALRGQWREGTALRRARKGTA